MTFNLNDLTAFLPYGDFADIYLEDSQSLIIRWEGGAVESISETRERGLGLRFLNGRETRFGHLDAVDPMGSGLSSDEQTKFQKIFQELSSGLPIQALPPLRELPKKIHQVRLSPAHVTTSDKVKFLEEVQRCAASDPSVRQVILNYGEKIKRVKILNSAGALAEEERVYVVLSVMVVAEDVRGQQRGYDSLGGLCGWEIFEGGRAGQLAREVSARAVAKLSAPSAPAGAMPVVIASSAGGTLIHEAIGHSLEADAVLEGTSPAYHGKLGQVVANPKLTVFDDPTQAGARGSFFYDDEGTPSEATKLIDRGVLKNYLFDQLSSRRAGGASNGHGRRESYRHRPIPRMSNTFIARGPDDPQEILNSFKDGFLVTKMGGGQVNTANGDFVFEVEEGFRVDSGKKTLVRGATLLGNGPEVLLNIDRVGSDLGWGIGTCGKEGQGVPVSDAMPTVRIKSLVIGGG